MNSSAPTVFASKGELVCRPVHWIDVVKFLVFNYVLHALTVLSSPGDGALLSTLKRLFSLFIPMFGTVRALTAIHRFACGESTPVQVALRARALCMIYDPVSEPLVPWSKCANLGFSGRVLRVTAATNDGKRTSGIARRHKRTGTASSG